MHNVTGGFTGTGKPSQFIVEIVRLPRRTRVRSDTRPIGETRKLYAMYIPRFNIRVINVPESPEVLFEASSLTDLRSTLPQPENLDAPEIVV